MSKVLFDALIPCYNEGDRIGNVLTVALSSPLIKEVIVVNDGSTDNTKEVLENFPKAKIIHFPKNRGKGDALKEGIQHVTTDAVFLFDADISGFTHEHIEMMAKKYVERPNSMVVGIREKSPFYLIHWLRANVLPLIAGERLMATSDFKKIMSNDVTAEYGDTVYMNYYFNVHRRPIVKVLLKGVNDVPKYKKSTYGLTPQIAETINITQKYLEIYFTELPTDVYNKIKLEQKIKKLYSKGEKIFNHLGV